jgi:hypothetical protein
MTDQQPSPPSGPSPAGQSPTGQSPNRNPWVTALLILIGIILLLPGLCSLIFSVAILRDSGSLLGGGFGSLLIFCLFVGAGGVALIVFAVRR